MFTKLPRLKFYVSSVMQYGIKTKIFQKLKKKTIVRITSDTTNRGARIRFKAGPALGTIVNLF